jgi:hypothetical protein
MANTVYTEIYTIFQSQMNDPVFNALTFREDLSKQYLINSIPKFRRSLQNLDDRDDTATIPTFNIQLTEDVKQILGNLMLVEYMSSHIVSLDLLKQAMTSKDFGLTSQANHLEKLLLLRNDRKKDISKMIVDYCYSFSDLTKLK